MRNFRFSFSFRGFKKLFTASTFIGVLFICLIFSSERFNNGLSNYSYAVPNLPECKPPRKIAFLKTSKCGTTTLLNILCLYASRNNLIKQEVHVGRIRSGPFNRTFHLVDPSLKGDLLYHHFIWNRDEVVAQLGPDVVAFTILRDPYDLFESYYSFTLLPREFGMDLKEFIQLLRNSNPMNWRASAASEEQIWKALYKYGLAVSLGLPVEFLQNDTAIDNHIAKIEKELDLVMISERMEESFILFRYLMCWKPEDIVAFDQNVRSSNTVVKLDDDDRKELRRWLKADEKIYKHFYQLFEARVTRYPGDIKREIQQRISAREEMRTECILNHRNNSDSCAGFNSLVANTRQNLI